MNRLGLTLMELIVAITITGMALTGGYATFSSLVDNRSRLAEATEETATASAVRNTIVSWLEGARLTLAASGPRFRGLDGVYQDLEDDALSFLTTSRTPLGTGESIVRIYVDRDDETPQTGLVASIAEWRGTQQATIVMNPDVRSLDIRYLSGVLGSRSWLPSWISATLLPAAIEITLAGATPADSLPRLLQLPVLVVFRGGT